MTLPGEIARFKVFPAGKQSPHYWTVFVFANKGYMRRGFHQLNLTKDHDDRFGAIVMPQVRLHLIRGKWRTIDPSLGNVFFARTQLGMGTQCHESVHMALGYLRHIRKCPRLSKQTDAAEETLAYCIDRCASQLNYNFIKFHCYRK